MGERLANVIQCWQIIVKKYEFAMAYFILKASIPTAGKSLKQIQREQIESLLGV